MGYRDGTGDDGRERPSWREIDKARDRSSHRKERRDPRDAGGAVLRDDARKKQYLREAGRILGGKKASPEQQAAARAVLDSAGTPEFPAAVQAYVGPFGVPEDWDVLLAFLDVTDPDLFETATEKLAALFPARGPAEQRLALSKLRVVATAAKDADLVEIAREALEKIG